MLLDLKAEDIRYEIEKLFITALEGDGPVLIDLPDDLQRQEINEKIKIVQT